MSIISSNTALPVTAVSSKRLLGYLAITLAVTIWAAFAISMRAIHQSGLTSADVALIRFLVPALLLLPLLPSRWAALRTLRLRDVLMVTAGAGLPFFLLASAGARLSSAAYVSALIAGTAPLFVALLSRTFLRQSISRTRGFGLLVIIAGVIALVAAQGSVGFHQISGITLLLTASLCWAIYSIGLRRVRVDPVGCAMLVTLPSVPVIGVLMITGVLSSNLANANVQDILYFAAVQGVGVGIVSTVVYALATQCLGAQRCTTIGALAPVLAAIMAVPLLGETLALPAILGILTISAGVALANRSPKA